MKEARRNDSICSIMSIMFSFNCRRNKESS